MGREGGQSRLIYARIPPHAMFPLFLISPFLKGVAVPFLMFRMNECCDGMDAKEQLYTAGGFAFGLF